MARTVLAAVLLFVSALAVGGCGAPQIGPDKDVFKTVDALYTAVALKDTTLVDRCNADLEKFREGGRMSNEVSDVLKNIVGETKSGDWQTAQTHLSDFMEGQSR